METRGSNTRPTWADPAEYVRLAGFDSKWRELWWNSDYLQLLARRWRLSEVQRGLDVGCGVGHWGRQLSSLLPASASITGVDVEPAFFEHARAKNEELQLADRFDYRVGDAQALPFDDATFDLVTTQTVLIHVPDVRRALAEMLRVLRPGGLLLAAEPNKLQGTMAMLGAHPRPADENLLGLVRLQLVCERGKLALGEGNSSVGDLLPGYLAELGATDIAAHQSDRCLPIYPPYEAEDQRIILGQQVRWAKERTWISIGPKPDAWRYFAAGGGTREEFEAAWALAEAQMDAFLAAVEARQYHGAVPFSCYLISARKR